MTKIKARGIFKGDTTIWIIYFFLCIISIVEIFSAGSTLAYKTGNYWMPMINQAKWLTIGTLVVFIVHNIPCRYFKVIPVYLYAFFVILLMVTLFAGQNINEGSRWMGLFGQTFQPSEFSKGIIVTGVALFLSYNREGDNASPSAFKTILVYMGIPCALIVTQNFSTAVIIFAVTVMMMFVGRVQTRQILMLLGALAVAAFAGIMLLKSLPNESSLYESKYFKRAKTWKARVEDFGKDSKPDNPEDFDMADNRQVGYSNIAISSAHITGKGPGNSEVRDMLSHAYTDFIYSIIIEETGVLGGGAVLMLYLILLWRAARIARRCERNFPAFLILGLALLMVFQAFANMMVAVGLLPVTGQTLPLISRGGSSILACSAYFGMMLSVSRYARRRNLSAAKATDGNSAAFSEDAEIEANFSSSGSMQ